MANIYDHLKSLISSEVVSKAAKELGDNHEQIAGAVKNLIPTMLGMYLNHGEKKSVQDTIKDAHSKNVLSNIGSLFMAYPEDDPKNGIGEKFVSSLFGEKERTLHGLIAGDQIMSNENSTRLTAMVGTVVAGVLGKHSYNDLLGEQSAILAAIPKEYRDKLGIKEVRKTNAQPVAASKKKCKLCWLWWLLGILLLLLLLWFLFRGCKSCKKEVVVPPVVVEKPVESNTYDLTLPTGESIVITKGLMMDKLITFLRSDTYKNATDEELKKHWFEFENIDFEYNSGTQYTEGSDQTIKRLAFVLKYFPDAKIRIGGNADVKGREGVNMAISEQRAVTIEKNLEQLGIDDARVRTDGFGEEYAVIPATATNAERAPDRDIAMRFWK